MQTKHFDLNPLKTAMRPDLAVEIPVTLPVGKVFRKGRLLGLVTYATPTPEIRTLTISGSPTGFNGNIVYTADKVYTGTLANAVSAIPTAAQMKTALETIFGTGNVSVSYSAGVYTVTFANTLANKRIGGTFSTDFTYTAGTSPSAAWAISTRGTCGLGQYDTYDDSASDGTQTAKAALKWDYVSDPQGGQVTEAGQGGQPFSPVAYCQGFFRTGDLLGLDANGVTDLGKLIVGTDYTQPDAIINIR